MPLVHHLTNFITANDCAFITRALGALPVMAVALEEAPYMVCSADALVLNIGSITKSSLITMLKTGLAANHYNIPIIFDPVGAGSTNFRTKAAINILNEVSPSVIKGNASEIKTLAGETPGIKGVESKIFSIDEIIPTAKRLASKTGAIIAVTGKIDIVVKNDNVVQIYNGHPLMGKTVGTGCMCTSVIASFAALNNDFFQATITALSIMGIAGELAANNCRGPASFRVNLLDEIHLLSDYIINKMSKIEYS